MAQKKLEIFGDSIFKGVIYSAEKGKYLLCDDHDFSSVEQMGITVKNNSKMGATINKGIKLLTRRLENIDRNTTVITEFGGNDCDYYWQSISENPEGDFLPNTPKKDFEEKYCDLLTDLCKRGARVIVSTLYPLNAQKYMNWISKDKSYENILKWLGDVDHLKRWQEGYNRLITDIARKCNCNILDIWSVFSSKAGDFTCADGIHPTPSGHRIIHKEICNCL